MCRWAAGVSARRLRGNLGYAEFLEAIGDPDHQEHESMLEWVGGRFDPEAFDPPDHDRLVNPRHLTAI